MEISSALKGYRGEVERLFEMAWEDTRDVKEERQMVDW